MRKISSAGLAGAMTIAAMAIGFSGSAVAGPIVVASPNVIEPDSPTEQVYYRSYCRPHYVRHWRYRHYSSCAPCYRGYGYSGGYSYPSEYQYGWGLAAPVAAAADVATFPLAAIFGAW
jgi:hypothetical protein